MTPKLETVADVLKRRAEQNQDNQNTKITKRKFSTIEKRQIEQKKKMIEEIRNVYISSIACQKTGISRATLYRWMIDDYEFGREFKKSQIEGRNTINDLAESKLIGRVKNDDPRATIFWLTHMHPNFINPLLALSEDTRERKLPPEYLAKLAKRLAQWKNNNLK
ncbi:MAG: hypothetical protein WCK59_01110 [Candidatus Falkowbacteria bacterium]